MVGDQTRVRKLNVSAQNRQQVTRFLPDLEDALHTASLPSGNGEGEVILVRKLDLGRIAPGTSRQAIALRIETAMAGLVAMPANSTMAGTLALESAPAIAWPDRVTQLAHVAKNLTLKRADGNAEWWIAATLKVEQKQVNLASFVATVRSMIDAAPPQAHPEILGALALQILNNDAGTTLNGLNELAEKLAAQVLKTSIAPFAGKDMTATDLLDVWIAPEEIEKFLGTGLLQALKQNVTAHAAFAILILVHRYSRLSVASLLAAKQLRLQLAATHNRSKTDTLRTKPLQKNLPTELVRLPENDANLNRQTDQNNGLELPPIAPNQVPKERFQPKEIAPVHRLEDAPTPVFDVATRGGGFPVLINLMRSCGLEAMEKALGVPLCLTLARAFVARHLAGDALLEALPAPLDLSDWNWAKSQPHPSMMALATGYASVPDQPNLFMLFIRRGAGIALVDGAQLAMLNAVRGKAPLQVLVFPLRPLRQVLCAGLWLALAFVMRQITGHGMRYALRRNAWLAAGLTHIDITQDLSQVRIEERRSGLDVSPHWVPWAARFVHLHFKHLEGRNVRA